MVSSRKCDSICFILKPKDFFGNVTALRLVEALLTREAPPNTLLFSGPGGVGKALLAYFFSKALVCEKRGSFGDSPLNFCDECYACKSLEAGQQSEFVGVRPRSTELTLAQVREDYGSFESAYLHPRNLAYRIFLLEECHSISEELANSMLKLLEEPPTRSIFILITDKPYLLLPTILSRSFHIRFRQEDLRELESFLMEQRQNVPLRVSESAIKLSAFFSHGRVGLAKTLLLDPDFLPTLSGLLVRLTDGYRKNAIVSPAFLVNFSQQVIELSDELLEVLLKVETGEDLPAGFYTVPWRRHREEDETGKVPQVRRNELGRTALRFVLESIRSALFKLESELGRGLASTSLEAFSDANSMLDVNLRREQVVDYLLSSLPSARM